MLVHYQDSGTENADAKRWEDRIWVFEKAGDQLALDGLSDRRVRRRHRALRGASAATARAACSTTGSRTRRSRSRSAAGLAINSRGSRSKALSGSDAKGWSSARRGGAGYKSSRFITYEETWNIDGLPDKPRFERQDSMGSGGSEDFEGRTLYETTTVEAGGNVLRGSFDRDGTRKGTFRLARSGQVHSVAEGGGKTAGEMRGLGREAMGKQMKQAEFIAMLTPGLVTLPGGRSEEQWREAVQSPNAKEERLALRAALEEGLRTQVLSEDDVRSHYTLLTNLAVELERLFVEEGKSLEDLRTMMMKGEVNPGGAS